MRDALLVAAGGAIGSVLRWWMSVAIQRSAPTTFPWGTFAVNALGSLAIGVLAGLVAARVLESHAARAFLVVGLLGGFTTFSAFSLESLGLIRDGRWILALAYAVGSVVIGIVAAAIGMASTGR